MKQRLLYFLLLFAPFLNVPVSAQELLVNGSFEDENICTEYSQNCAPEGWIESTLQSNFYFDDQPQARHGQHFIGVAVRMNGRYRSRNFVRSQLLCGMRKDALYTVRFFTRSAYNLDSAGVYFSEDDPLYRKFGIEGVKPSLWIAEGLNKGEKGPWISYVSQYRATGTEAFITIGLFGKNDPQMNRSHALVPDYWFCIDSVSVVPVDPAEKLCSTAPVTKDELYKDNMRHSLLEKRIYALQRRPKVNLQLTPTVKTKG